MLVCGGGVSYLLLFFVCLNFQRARLTTTEVTSKTTKAIVFLPRFKCFLAKLIKPPPGTSFSAAPSPTSATASPPPPPAMPPLCNPFHFSLCHLLLWRLSRWTNTLATNYKINFHRWLTPKQQSFYSSTTSTIQCPRSQPACRDKHKATVGKEREKGTREELLKNYFIFTYSPLPHSSSSSCSWPSTYTPA